MINVSFKGVVQAETYQITEEVAEIITTVVDEIAKCSDKLGEVQKELFEVFYQGLPVVNIIGKIGVKLVGGLLNEWLLHLTKDTRFKMCQNVAMSRWRSPLEIALMGI